MKLLLDTCVISELGRLGGNDNVRHHISRVSDDALYLSVITIGELRKGIAILADGHKKTSLTTWFGTLQTNYSARILPVDLLTAHIWGELTASARVRGKVIPACDGLIAATAQRHGLTVMTRNVADFVETGVTVLNPWEAPLL